jgi:hypothetical protein
MRIDVSKFFVFLCLPCACWFGCEARNSPASPDQRCVLLMELLDSLANALPNDRPRPIENRSDSIFKHQQKAYLELSSIEFAELKASLKDQRIPARFHNMFFPSIDTSGMTFEQGRFIPITFHSFGGDSFEHFAIQATPVSSYEALVCFFKGPKMIARHAIINRFGIEFFHFLDEKQRMTLGYEQHFAWGTGLWSTHWHLFKYKEEGLQPVLNEICDNNRSCLEAGCLRAFRLKTKVQSTRPLILAFQYWVELPFGSKHSPLRIVDQKSLISYTWDEQKWRYIPQFDQTGFNLMQKTAFALEVGEKEFINAYQNELKAMLVQGGQQGKAIKRYLESIVSESDASLPLLQR